MELGISLTVDKNKEVRDPKGLKGAKLKSRVAKLKHDKVYIRIKQRIMQMSKHLNFQ